MDIKNSVLFNKPIAHRGLHMEGIPENSLAAFENAILNHYPIEADVRIIDDGTLIVFHDDTLGRMTDKDGYASNLRAADLSKLHLKNSTQTIPTFEQLLKTVNGKVPLLIETKVTAKVGVLEKKIAEMLKGYNGEFAIQSFDPYSLEWFKKNKPDFARGQLSALCVDAKISLLKRMALSHLKVNKISEPHFVSYKFTDLPNKFVTKANLPTLGWTVRSNADYDKAAPNCDNIIFENFFPQKK